MRKWGTTYVMCSDYQVRAHRGFISKLLATWLERCTLFSVRMEPVGVDVTLYLPAAVVDEAGRDLSPLYELHSRTDTLRECYLV